MLLIDPQPGLSGTAEQRMFIDCVPLDADEDNYGDTPAGRALCESTKHSTISGVYAVCPGWIRSPAQRAGAWLAEGEVHWAVTGTVQSQHTTSADFHTLSEHIASLMTEAALRNAMTAIEELILVQQNKVSAG